VDQVLAFEKAMHRAFRDDRPEILAEIRDKKAISAELDKQIQEGMAQVRDQFLADQQEAKSA
jgi:hypothetical protein